MMITMFHNQVNCVLYVMMALLSFTGHDAVQVEFCAIETLQIQCPEGEVVVMETAQYGRMRKSRCMRADVHIGCSNDVLHLTDEWCSGKTFCEMLPHMIGDELTASNTACLEYLQMYLEVEYSCVKVVSSSKQCTSPQITHTIVPDTEGFISSHVTDETGCGSIRSPWMINALPGQTIELQIIDFGSSYAKKNENSSTSEIMYGYIVEGTTKTGFTNSKERQRKLYTSGQSGLQIQVLDESQRQGYGFLIQYEKTGCPDLKPPAHAWYKRDGGQAVIGCEWSQKTWHLSCDGHSWSGVVGNCSEPTTIQPTEKEMEIELPSALLLTCVVSVAVVLAAVVLVCGVVCIKKFRIKHEIEKVTTLPRQYGHYDLDPNIEMASMMYLPYKPCEHEGILVDVNPLDHQATMQALTPVPIWEQPLPAVPAKPSITSTVQTPARRGRTPGDGDEGMTGSPEDSTIRSGRSDLSTLSGHKYSALNTTA